MQCYSSAVYAMVCVHLFASLSVYSSQIGVLQTRLNAGSRKQRRMIA